jgi:hypothetical protein
MFYDIKIVTIKQEMQMLRNLSSFATCKMTNPSLLQVEYCLHTECCEIKKKVGSMIACISPIFL